MSHLKLLENKTPKKKGVLEYIVSCEKCGFHLVLRLETTGMLAVIAGCRCKKHYPMIMGFDVLLEIGKIINRAEIEFLEQELVRLKKVPVEEGHGGD